MKGKIIRREVMVHEIIAILKCQYVCLVEVKLDARAIMCPHLKTGEAHQRVILLSISVMIGGSAAFTCGISRAVNSGDWSGM
jgi:hypothetical protein